MKLIQNTIVILVFVFLVISCNKSSFVGSDLFIPESIELFYKDDFNIIAKTVKRDSTLTSDGINFGNLFLNGMLDDPYFGKTTAEMFIDLHIGQNYPLFKYEVDGTDRFVTLDSAILVIGLNPESAYGDTLIEHEVFVNVLLDEIPQLTFLYSNYIPLFSEERPIGQATVIPNHKDTLTVIEPGDTTTYAEMLRVPLQLPVFNALIIDTSLVTSDFNFVNFLPGIRIKSVPANGNSMWGMDRSKTAENPYNSIIMYYTREGAPGSFRIFVDGERHSFFSHDYTGSIVESFLDDIGKGDSLLFLQGMSGTDIEIDIPELGGADFKDVIINRATLEFFVLEDENVDIYSPLDRIIISRFREDGSLVIVEDVFLSAEVLQNAAFRGDLEEVVIDGQLIKKYTAILSVHTLRLLNDEFSDTRLVISARDKIDKPNRSIIFGPGHSEFPMKLKLTYSK